MNREERQTISCLGIPLPETIVTQPKFNLVDVEIHKLSSVKDRGYSENLTCLTSLWVPP